MCCLLFVECWLFDVCCMLYVGCLSVGCWLLVVGCVSFSCLLVVFCSVFVRLFGWLCGCWVVCCLVFAVCCLLLFVVRC